MPSRTFAFIHAITPERLQPFQAAAPDVEFLVPGDTPLPAGLERADAAAISWGGPPIDDILAAAPRLRWLHQRGAGIDRIATPRLVESDVVVTNGSGNHASNISEHLLALMLAFARQLPALIRSQQNALWEPPASGSLFELSEQTLAIVGTGAIGGALAPRAAALGMTVIGVRRSAAAAPPAGIERIVTIDRIDEALGIADHVAIALPLTAETRGLFSTALIAKMKPGAYLYNVGRGAIVDPAALLDALELGFASLKRSGDSHERAKDAAVRLQVLTPREREVLDGLAEGLPNKTIAYDLGISPRTVEIHRANLMSKLEVRSLSEALRLAFAAQQS